MIAAKGGVKHVHSAGEFEKELAAAGSRLVIVDFFATWVGGSMGVAMQQLPYITPYPTLT